MFGLFEDVGQIGFVALERKGGSLFLLKSLRFCRDIGTRAMARSLLITQKICKKQGGEEISIGIIQENKRLWDWYRSYGFIITGTKRFDHLPFDVCFMKLEIL